uniref:Putative secreted protein n=1 Tax=Xenopsylla cheopis TaxID=163159 RepID=A0A6M2DXI2_XENCH
MLHVADSLALACLWGVAHQGVTRRHRRLCSGRQVDQCHKICRPSVSFFQDVEELQSMLIVSLKLEENMTWK